MIPKRDIIEVGIGIEADGNKDRMSIIKFGVNKNMIWSRSFPLRMETIIDDPENDDDDDDDDEDISDDDLKDDEEDDEDDEDDEN